MTDSIAVTIIDNTRSLASLLDSLDGQPINPPSFYLDIEGIRLSRDGSISIIQLYHLPQNHVYLLDVFVLKQAAFDAPNDSGTTFRSILESAEIPKVFFDVRNDSDALFAHFNISLRGIQDLQLLELATGRFWLRTRVNGLARCIKEDAGLSSDALHKWETVKCVGKRLFGPEYGGSYEVFHTRPLQQDIIDYCSQDVVCLPKLWNVYMDKIDDEWLQRVQEETENRVVQSQSSSYDPHSREKTMSPWPSYLPGPKSKPAKVVDTVPAPALARSIDFEDLPGNANTKMWSCSTCKRKVFGRGTPEQLLARATSLVCFACTLTERCSGSPSYDISTFY
ncbi:uncharacterized protein KY384_005725 [Bacidia gigantensis]|uniref:uncharacterized protein n=1 Tax=Bacidia gigantensis TaxID=2732470 RepID=UPI001D03B254|nr:uncharacterized protein KY384_005725 [Bacidia gigantensis]KAG8529090.1 hypothetical protein KY384_005725 [Bacidia gigantensis]